MESRREGRGRGGVTHQTHTPYRRHLVRWGREETAILIILKLKLKTKTKDLLLCMVKG